MLGRLLRMYHSFLNYKKQRYIDALVRKGLHLGKNVLVVDTFFFDPSHCYLISIGDNCTICPNVRLVAHDASTKKFLGYTKFGRIDIKENCFIGDSSVVLPNVTIGPNTIIGAGSIVTKSVPPDTVAAGNPAKPICSLSSYLSGIKNQAAESGKIFGEEYLIENLNDAKRDELLRAVEKNKGFIV